VKSWVNCTFSNPQNSDDSVECAICRNTYHMECVRPPLLKKPARGFAWACAPCSRAQERRLEARRTPIVGEIATDARPLRRPSWRMVSDSRDPWDKFPYPQMSEDQEKERSSRRSMIGDNWPTREIPVPHNRNQVQAARYVSNMGGLDNINAVRGREVAENCKTYNFKFSALVVRIFSRILK
jgi:hypothetical protein